MPIGSMHPPSTGASVVGPTSTQASRKSGVAYTPGPQPAVGVDDTARPTSADVGRQPAATATAYQPPTWTGSKPAYASQYAAVRTDVAVHTSAETLTAQSLLLLGRHAASPQSSPHTSVREWLQTSGTAAPPPSPAESVSSSSSELQQAFASGAEAAMVMPPPARSSRMSRTCRRSVASSLAMEIFGFSKEMTSHVAHMAGQMQTEAKHREEAQQVEAKRREKAQRAEAERRKEAQREEARAQRAEAERREEVLRVEARKCEELAVTREQMLIQMKTVTDQTSADREKAQIEANQRREQAQLEVTQNREQLLMEHGLKRQKMLVDANTTLLQEKLKMDVNREVANLEALERRG